MHYMTDNPLRQLPPINQILEHPVLQPLRSEHAHEIVVGAIRSELDGLRERIKNGEADRSLLQPETLARRVIVRVESDRAPRFRSVINATGIVLHTNLGRSALAEAAAQAAYEAGRGYLNLELDLADGKRSSRQEPIRDILARLTGAESATVVNNCAAATVIALRSLAAGREVIVSRGQLIEIGGSFRIPEIMAVSGAHLREVGTTNITRLTDYEQAIGPNTGLLMRIHPSNFRVRGFTEEVSLADLVTLGRQHNLPVIDDAGSGALLDMAGCGLTGEPIVPQSVAAGADLVLCSGDKLLGGPQAGLIMGKKALIERIEKDPLMRAFRVDKMTLAALETTLRLYLNPTLARREIPTLRLLSSSRETIRRRAEAFVSKLRTVPGIGEVEVIDDDSFAGGGSLPDLPLGTAVIRIKPPSIGAAQFAQQLRLGQPPVVARVSDGQLLFDLRTVFEWQEDDLAAAISLALSRSGEKSLTTDDTDGTDKKEKQGQRTCSQRA
jgi:L-seryl-tRNA(Ser) seleniumtransferase